MQELPSGWLAHMRGEDQKKLFGVSLALSHVLYLACTHACFPLTLCAQASRSTVALQDEDPTGVSSIELHGHFRPGAKLFLASLFRHV